MKQVSNKTKKMAAANDLLRQTFWGGKVVMTYGVSQLDDHITDLVFAAVRDFDTFTEDNDPYGEHDFGSVVVGTQKFFWKIDYYDQRLEYASSDPTNSDVTERVLTIMLAEEY